MFTKKEDKSNNVTIFIPVFLRDVPDSKKMPTELKDLGPEKNGLHCIDVRRFIENDFQAIAEALNKEFKTDRPYAVQKNYDPIYERGHEQPGASAFQKSYYKYVMGIVFVEAKVKASDLTPETIYKDGDREYDGYTVKPTTVISKNDIVAFHKGPCTYNGRDLAQYFPDLPEHSQNKQPGVTPGNPAGK